MAIEGFAEPKRYRPKDEYKVKLKLTKEELEYLTELAEKKKKSLFRKHNFRLEDKKQIEKQGNKEYFLTSLCIKLMNKYMELE